MTTTTVTINRLYYETFSPALVQEMRNTVAYYDNDEWVIYDEFRDQETIYRFNDYEILQYKDMIKCYLLLLMEAKLSKGVIYSKFLDLRWAIQRDITKLTLSDIIYERSHFFQTAITIKNFICFANIDNKKFLKECERISDDMPNNPRPLVCFDTIYRLDEVIKQFARDGSEDDIRYYYPILIWWAVGSVIPMRPTEITLMKKGCVRYDENVCSYKIEVPDIKHKNQTTPNYSEIAIDENLAKLILRYEEMVNEDRTYLLSNVEYCKRHRRMVRKENSFKTMITRVDLDRILQDFYDNIVAMNYEVIKKGDEMGPGKIERIQLGDLRHYSLYNLVASGLDPYTIKQMARHTNISSQLNYYGHIFNMSLSKIEILAERIRSRGINGYNIYDTEHISAFDSRQLQLLNLEREENAHDNMTPVVNGFCASNLDCEAECDCMVCKNFIPDDRQQNIKAIIHYRYNEELSRLTDVCETMRIIYTTDNNYAQLASLSKERETIIQRMALISARGA